MRGQRFWRLIGRVMTLSRMIPHVVARLSGDHPSGDFQPSHVSIQNAPMSPRKVNAISNGIKYANRLLRTDQLTDRHTWRKLILQLVFANAPKILITLKSIEYLSIGQQFFPVRLLKAMPHACVGHVLIYWQRTAIWTTALASQSVLFTCKQSCTKHSEFVL